MSDLISRQDTIDGINEYIEEYSEVDSDGNHSEKWCAMQEAKMVIENMPSAQSEPAIPISWLEEEIERLESYENSFAVLDAVQLKALIKRWRGEQNENT